MQLHAPFWLRAATVASLALSSVLAGCGGGARPAAGSLDNHFGKHGVVVTSVGSASPGQNVPLVVQPDGKLVVATAGCKTIVRRCGVWRLLRFDADGSIDSSFGSGGQVTTRVGINADVNALVMEPGGKLLAAGGSSRGGFTLVRYNEDGSLDKGFGSDGEVMTRFGWSSAAMAVVVQPDGKLVAAGFQIGLGFTHEVFALARYTASGSLDPSFGRNGRATTAIGLGAGAQSVVLEPGGGLIAAGTAVEKVGHVSVFALARYKRNGKLDRRFGVAGVTRTRLGDYATLTTLVKTRTGKLVAAGTAESAGPGIRFVLVRYNPNGTLDQSFGAAGRSSAQVGLNASYEADLRAMVIGRDGTLVAAGRVQSHDDDHEFLVLCRFRADGTLDQMFGLDGKIRSLTANGAYLGALGLTSDGKLVASGITFGSSGRLLRLARYNP